MGFFNFFRSTRPHCILPSQLSTCKPRWKNKNCKAIKKSNVPKVRTKILLFLLFLLSVSKKLSLFRFRFLPFLSVSFFLLFSATPATDTGFFFLPVALPKSGKYKRLRKLIILIVLLVVLCWYLAIFMVSALGLSCGTDRMISCMAARILDWRFRSASRTVPIKHGKC